MKFLLLSAALISSAVAPAALAEEAPVAAPAAVALNGDSPIEAIAASETGKAALSKHLPGVLEHPGYEQFKGLSLRALAPLSAGIITEEKIALLETELKAAK